MLSINQLTFYIRLEFELVVLINHIIITRKLWKLSPTASVHSVTDQADSGTVHQLGQDNEVADRDKRSTLALRDARLFCVRYHGAGLFINGYSPCDSTPPKWIIVVVDVVVVVVVVLPRKNFENGSKVKKIARSATFL